MHVQIVNSSVTAVSAIHAANNAGQPAATPDSVFPSATIAAFVASSQSGAVRPDSGAIAHEAVFLLLGDDRNSVSVCTSSVQRLSAQIMQGRSCAHRIYLMLPAPRSTYLVLQQHGPARTPRLASQHPPFAVQTFRRYHVTGALRALSGGPPRPQRMLELQFGQRGRGRALREAPLRGARTPRAPAQDRPLLAILRVRVVFGHVVCDASNACPRRSRVL